MAEQTDEIAEQYILRLYSQIEDQPGAIFASQLEYLPDFWDNEIGVDEQVQRISNVLQRQLEFVQSLGFFDKETTIELRMLNQPGNFERVKLFFIVSVEEGARSVDAWRLFHSAFPSDLDFRLSPVPKEYVNKLRKPLTAKGKIFLYEWLPKPTWLNLPDIPAFPLVQPMQLRQDSGVPSLRLLAQQTTPIVLGFAIQPVPRESKDLVREILDIWQYRLNQIETILAFANTPGGMLELENRYRDAFEVMAENDILEISENDPFWQLFTKEMHHEEMEEFILPRHLLEMAQSAASRLLKAPTFYFWRVHAASTEPLSEEFKTAVASDLGRSANQSIPTAYECWDVTDYIEPQPNYENVRMRPWRPIPLRDNAGNCIPAGEIIDDQAATALIGMPILPRGGIPGIPSYPANPFSTWQVNDRDENTPEIALGDYVDSRLALTGPKGQEFSVSIHDFTRHALITGSTGSGKTTTCKRLLKQISNRKIPFMVIEPVKHEYRELVFDVDLLDSLGSTYPQIFRLGSSRCLLWFNPFYIRPGISPNAHISQLQSCFMAAFALPDIFGMVFNHILHKSYALKLSGAQLPGDGADDKSWVELLSGAKDSINKDQNLLNKPISSDLPDDHFPDLPFIAKIAEKMILTLDYKGEFGSNLKAAIAFRLKHLQDGIIGSLLRNPSNQKYTINSYERELPKLLAIPTIFELELLADKEEKALIMAFMLSAIYEYYQLQPTTERLKHLLLLEEAHSLLENVPRIQNEDNTNTRGKAIEMFADMLAEIRSRGQGLIIAEQLPSKLISEAIKNTNLKIMHRLTARDDRDVLGAAMNLNLHQSKFVTTLRRGQAIVFREGLSEPALVKIWNIPKSPTLSDELEPVFQSLAYGSDGKLALPPTVFTAVKSFQKQKTDLSIQEIITSVDEYLKSQGLQNITKEKILYFLASCGFRFPTLTPEILSKLMQR